MRTDLRRRSVIPAIVIASLGMSLLIFSVAVSWAANSRIVFSQIEKKGDKQRLVTVNPDGRDQRKLTNPPNKHVHDIDAQISPDGRRVIWERDFDEDESEIRIAGADGQNERPIDLGCVDPCAVDLSPTWIPGTNRIFFTPVVGPFDGPGHSARSAVLFTAALPDGTDILRASEPGIDGVFEDYYARYSPDGSYIVFTRIRNKPFNSAVFRMNADGTDVRQLTPWKLDGDLADLSPATSGKTKDLVVFETYGHGAPEGKSQNLVTVPGTCASVSDCRDQLRYLTDYGAGPTAAFNPSWSPNGKQIAYTKFKGDDEECCVGDIYTMRADGSHRRAVVKSPLFEYRPDWGPAP